MPLEAKTYKEKRGMIHFIYFCYYLSTKKDCNIIKTKGYLGPRKGRREKRGGGSLENTRLEVVFLNY